MEDTGVKVYKPKTPTKQLLPCVIFFHGGGWTLGSAGMNRVATHHKHNSRETVHASILSLITLQKPALAQILTQSLSLMMYLAFHKIILIR